MLLLAVMNGERAQTEAVRFPYTAIKKIGSLQYSLHIPDRRIEKEVVGQFFESDFITDMVHRSLPGDVVWDVGASSGTHTVPLAMQVGEKGAVYAFEPDEQSVAALRKNCALNTLFNVVIRQTPLWSQDEQVSVHANDQGDFAPRTTRQGEDASTPYATFNRETTFSARTISSLIHNDKLPSPDILKIDVEGSEYAVLQGMDASVSPRHIYLEVHPLYNDMAVKSVDLLTERGYTVGYEQKRGNQILYRFDRK